MSPDSKIVESGKDMAGYEKNVSCGQMLAEKARRRYSVEVAV